ncbi:MAG: choice-of-anchor J domain-containing protein, partial [Bacteroidia bacterium]|nr:choice-of-anchor J domain-containing protein [Bacteroidia bacterium]
GNTYNDTARTNFIVNTVPSVISELYESFDGQKFPPDGWTVSSSARIEQWVSTSLARYTGTGSAAYPNLNDRGIGNFYGLELPVLNISSSNKTNLSFRYSYGLYSGSNGDSLQVLISRDCGSTWQKIYDKGGTRLAIVYSSIAFYPLFKGSWKKETLSLSAFPGNVRIRFRNICGYGNNVFLDDVEVRQLTGIEETNLADNFTVYPNPASTSFSISGLPANSEIQLTDLTGKMLINGKTENSLTIIEISKLPTGIYI